MPDAPHGLGAKAFMRTTVACLRIAHVRFQSLSGCRGKIPVGARPGRPAVALRTQTRNAVVVEKEIGFEFVQIRNFKPPARNAPQQGAQHRFVKTRRRGKDNVPEIDPRICQGDAEHAGAGGIVLIIFHNSRQGLLVDPNTPDFDGLADVEIPIDDDCCAIVTDINGVAFAREIFTAFRGSGNTNAQVQRDSFTAAEIFTQRRSRAVVGLENVPAGFVAQVVSQATPPMRRESAAIHCPQFR